MDALTACPKSYRTTELSETLSYGSRLGNSAKRFPMGRV
ncbi:hypothetical protein LEP1GSC175_1797 [Leptospira santarosai str. HAI821]|nr:hypothetical protein LEP1GSC175_1797 [Leptospira santarosai str. HAI821]